MKVRDRERKEVVIDIKVGSRWIDECQAGDAKVFYIFPDGETFWIENTIVKNFRICYFLDDVFFASIT